MTFRGDGPELPSGPCTRQPASPQETEGAATGPGVPGPPRLGEAGRTLPRSFRRQPASISISGLQRREQAQFWWFTWLWAPRGPQAEPSASQAHPIIRPSLVLRVPGPPPGHLQPAQWVHTRPWQASPSPLLHPAPAEKAQRRARPTAHTPNRGVCLPRPARGAGLVQCRVPLGGSLPGQQALPCVPGPREQHSLQAGPGPSTPGGEPQGASWAHCPGGPWQCHTGGGPSGPKAPHGRSCLHVLIACPGPARGTAQT